MLRACVRFIHENSFLQHPRETSTKKKNTSSGFSTIFRHFYFHCRNSMFLFCFWPNTKHNIYVRLIKGKANASSFLACLFRTDSPVVSAPEDNKYDRPKTQISAIFYCLLEIHKFDRKFTRHDQFHFFSSVTKMLHFFDFSKKIFRVGILKKSVEFYKFVINGKNFETKLSIDRVQSLWIKIQWNWKKSCLHDPDRNLVNTRIFHAFTIIDKMLCGIYIWDMIKKRFLVPVEPRKRSRHVFNHADRVIFTGL